MYSWASCSHTARNRHHSMNIVPLYTHLVPVLLCQVGFVCIFPGCAVISCSFGLGCKLRLENHSSQNEASISVSISFRLIKCVDSSDDPLLLSLPLLFLLLLLSPLVVLGLVLALSVVTELVVVVVQVQMVLLFVFVHTVKFLWIICYTSL